METRFPGWEFGESQFMIWLMVVESTPPVSSRAVRLPRAPFLVAGPVHFACLTEDGVVESGTVKDSRARREILDLCRQSPPVICHGPTCIRRFGGEVFRTFDALELFAFVRPARFCVPTVDGLCDALDLPRARDLEDQPGALRRAVTALLRELAGAMHKPETGRMAMSMARGGWSWGPSVLAALGTEDTGTRADTSGLDVWRRLPEWQETAPPPPPGDLAVDPMEARHRLSQLLGGNAESRPGQADYASAVTQVFAPRDEEGVPNFVMAEAGTGVGKTLGYIAPASIWAEKNEGPVWLSTYTRNLQHQIDDELVRLYPDEREKNKLVTLRKGRENYLCLLNYEEAMGMVRVNREEAVPMGLMARWIDATRDGDLTGGDFPSWLSDILGPRRTLGLSDRRGECIYASCNHYSRCFVERSVKKSRQANIVVANHALVMFQAARGSMDLGGRTTRLVFDEGHHVFDAADGAFSAHLSGMETAELRRWLRGAETRGGGRARGLKARVEDIAVGETAAQALDALIQGAAGLPAEGWRQRVADGRANGSAETFLAAVRQQVYARSSGVSGPYDMEVGCADPVPGLQEAAKDLHDALGRLIEPAKTLAKALIARLDEEADTLEPATRIRLDAASRSLDFRCIQTVEAWRDMLTALSTGTPGAFVDWFAVERHDGHDRDVAMSRHWVDPMVPFTQVVARPAHGVLVTSATLTDGSGDSEADWQSAEARTGAIHLEDPAFRVRVASPFDYPNQTRVLIVTDVRKDDLGQVASAYRELFKASGGGALGLFTAISRLRAVYERIVEPLEVTDLPLHAQHVDNLNLASLIDIFRSERDSCLLGTDALRDGVDVPGDALRMIVFDRVPWPRPTLLHKARRSAFSGRKYDEAVTRLRLKQAFGRLVRKADDRGVFVMLDPMTPTRLLGAFPEGVVVEWVGLAEAASTIGGFFADLRGAEKEAQQD